MAGRDNRVSRMAYHSALLGRDIEYALYRPGGAARADVDVWYFLHGSGGSAADWVRGALPLLDHHIERGTIAPLIAIIPSAPRVAGASWWTDSQYHQGMPMTQMLTEELAPIVETTLGMLVPRSRRGIAGYSRGGAAAVRVGLTHRDAFSRIIALSPAVYSPLPPLTSSARTCPAFGRGMVMFDEDRYRALNYPALLRRGGAPVDMYISIGGDDELSHSATADVDHDLDVEAARLHACARRATGVTSHLRAVPGGHGWESWAPGLVGGLSLLDERAGIAAAAQR